MRDLCRKISAQNQWKKITLFFAVAKRPAFPQPPPAVPKKMDLRDNFHDADMRDETRGTESCASPRLACSYERDIRHVGIKLGYARDVRDILRPFNRHVNVGICTSFFSVQERIASEIQTWQAKKCAAERVETKNNRNTPYNTPLHTAGRRCAKSDWESVIVGVEHS